MLSIRSETCKGSLRAEQNKRWVSGQTLLMHQLKNQTGVSLQAFEAAHDVICKLQPFVGTSQRL